jgi:hypothetical protein
MIRGIKVLLLGVTVLIWATTPALAATWVTVDERPTAQYQIDTETLNISGEESNRQLEVWMKSIPKNSNGIYMVAQYIVKENDLSFLMKERTTYSASGQNIGKFTAASDKWTANNANSPIGAIAARFFADYRKNPESFKNKEYFNAKISEAAKPASVSVTFDPKELQKALDNNRIKHGEKNDGVKWFYVRDTWTTYHLLNRERMTADFWLVIKAGTKYARFNFSFSDNRPGSHMLKAAVTISVDGKEWLLTQPVEAGATSFPESMFQYSFMVPDSLMQVLLNLNGGITVKWKHSWGGWNDYEYTIPAEIARNVQLMYAGCK